MRYTYDDEADALYLELREGVEIARSVAVDAGRVIDVGADGRPVGVEILAASAGVHISDLIADFQMDEFAENLALLEGRRFDAAGIS